MISLEEFAKIEANRAALYRFVAKLFRAPLTSEDIEMLAASDLATRAGDEAGIGHGLKVMGRYLAKRNTGTREMLGRDYTCAFLGVQEAEGKVALPFESAFTSDHQRYMGEARGKVYNIYKRCSLRLADGIDLPEDHLSFMCDFMAAMIDRTVTLFEEKDDASLRQNLLLQRAFLDRHIRNWFPEFARIASAIVQERFYKGALEYAHGVFDLDAKVLKNLLAEVGAARTSFDLSLWELSHRPRTRALLPIRRWMRSAASKRRAWSARLAPQRAPRTSILWQTYASIPRTAALIAACAWQCARQMRSRCPGDRREGACRR